MQNNTDELNVEQREAVTHIEGPALVLAGAGCGKTRVVVHRIAHLLELGVPANEILAVTFTNKAALEMQQRVQQITSKRVIASTFHSLGARILREGSSHLGFNSDYTIYDEKDSEALLKSCLKELGPKEEKGFLKSVKGQISDLKNELIHPHEMKVPHGDTEMAFVKQLYTLYSSRLREYNAVDFDDLLFLFADLLCKTEWGAQVCKRWSFILVDEYQDINKAQYTICKSLAGKSSNLFVVGDPDQSIYSWRGANVENILNFERDFVGAKVITLKQNYRSTNTILKAANALISNNERPYAKELHSDLGIGEKVGIHIFRSDREEADFVVSTIDSHLPKLSPLNMAIFYRTNSQSRIFEDYLLRAGIAYVIIGGFSFYQRREIKDILAYVRLVVSPADFISFERTINLPKRGFGPSFISKVKKGCDETKLPVLEFLAELLEKGKLGQKQRAGLESYLSVFTCAQDVIKREEDLDEVIREVIHTSGYLDYLKEDMESYQERKSNVEELVGKAFEWQEDSVEGALHNFLEELSLRSSSDEDGDERDQVRLMTLHNGKGLEFDLCFMVGMEEDLFPHINAKSCDSEIEEERRLCYVGMTRAKQHLHLTGARHRFLWGTPKMMRPSRFLDEIPEEYIKLHDSNRSYSRVEEEPQEYSEDSLDVGNCVTHRDFGRGTIERAYQTSLGLTYDVIFQDDGIKRSLVAKFAKLTRI